MLIFTVTKVNLHLVVSLMFAVLKAFTPLDYQFKDSLCYLCPEQFFVLKKPRIVLLEFDVVVISVLYLFGNCTVERIHQCVTLFTENITNCSFYRALIYYWRCSLRKRSLSLIFYWRYSLCDSNVIWMLFLILQAITHLRSRRFITCEELHYAFQFVVIIIDYTRFLYLAWWAIDLHFVDHRVALLKKGTALHI